MLPLWVSPSFCSFGGIGLGQVRSWGFANTFGLDCPLLLEAFAGLRPRAPTFIIIITDATSAAPTSAGLDPTIIRAAPSHCPYTTGTNCSGTVGSHAAAAVSAPASGRLRRSCRYPCRCSFMGVVAAGWGRPGVGRAAARSIM